MILIVMFAFVIGGLSVALCLAQVVDQDRLRELGRRAWRPRFTIRQLMAVVVLAALVFHMLTSRREGWISFWLLCLGALIWLVRGWQKEFVFLMGLKDGDFPGRHDKLIWAAMLTALAPIGVWFFRAYRLAHWPEPAADAATDDKGWADAADIATA